MRTSLLQIVTPELAQVATGLDPDDVATLTPVAERIGLLGRRARGPRTPALPPTGPRVPRGPPCPRLRLRGAPRLA